MAASANQSGNHHQHQEQSFFNGVGVGVASTSKPINGNSGLGRDTASAMKHNPGISTEWTAQEQAILEDGLIKYASESNINRYAKIAMLLPCKTVRDVALRTKWITSDQVSKPIQFQKKECNKRRKDDHSRKNREKREKFNESSSRPSQLSSQPSCHPVHYTAPTVSLDSDDGISYKAIGGGVGQLLEQNAQYLQQISANFSSFQIQENMNLFCQARDNLTKIMNSMNNIPDIMKQMPPLPVKLNEELMNNLLRLTHQR